MQSVGRGEEHSTPSMRAAVHRWRATDPVPGINKWKASVTEELPPLIDVAARQR